MKRFGLLEKSKRATTGLLTAMFFAVQLAVPLTFTSLASADHTNPNSAPALECGSGYQYITKYNLTSGQYVESVDGHSGKVTLSGTSSSGGNFTSTQSVYKLVTAGGGDEEVTLYQNGTMSGSFSNANLLNNGGQVPAISHVTFCGLPSTPVTAGVVTYVDLCGTANDTYTVPTTANVTYSETAGVHAATGTVTVTASANANYVLTAPYTFMHTFTNVSCDNPDTPTSAGTVTFDDACETDNDTYTVPTTSHVTYVFTGTSDEATAGTHDGVGTVSITAVADSGYTLTGPTVFSHTFTDEDCPQTKKITICHATSAVVNPYNKISVRESAADGLAGNSGQQPDHYGEHTGPIFDPAVHTNGGGWGDIIPPIAGVHGGLNWDAYGQAVYNNNCNLPTKVTPAVVSFTMPTCEVLTGSYMIPATAGVQYQVSLNGGSYQNVGEGTYTVAAGSTVAVKAVALNATYFLTGTTTWSSSFPAATDCVLGEVTPPLEGGRGGEVLGAVTPAVLADTGAGSSSTLTSVIIGVTGVLMALGLTILSRKQTNA